MVSTAMKAQECKGHCCYVTYLLTIGPILFSIFMMNHLEPRRCLSVREVRGRNKTYIALFFTGGNLEEEISNAAGESCSTLFQSFAMVSFCFLDILVLFRAEYFPKRFSISKHVRLLTCSTRGSFRK